MTDPARPPPDRFLDDGARPRLRYRDAGHGPAVLLIHGWLLDLTMWDALADALEPRFRVIRFDRRGFGSSAGVPSVAGDAADAARLLDRLGVGRYAVAGVSQGCRVALNLVDAAPDRAACLVLDGAPPVEGLPDRGWAEETPLEEYRRVLQEHGIEALRSRLASHPFLQLHRNDSRTRASLDAMLARYQGADLAPVAPAPPVAAPDRLRRLVLPTLVINGEFDTPQRLRIGEALCDCLPNAEHRIVPASRHMAFWDNPVAYNGFVSDFLTRNLHRWA